MIGARLSLSDIETMVKKKVGDLDILGI